MNSSWLFLFHLITITLTFDFNPKNKLSFQSIFVWEYLFSHSYYQCGSRGIEEKLFPPDSWGRSCPVAPWGILSRHLTSPYLSSSLSLIYNSGVRCSSNCPLKRLSWAVFKQCGAPFLHVYHRSFKKHLFYSSKAINKYHQIILWQQQQLNSFNIQPCPFPSEIQSEVASHGAARGYKCSYSRGKR